MGHNVRIKQLKGIENDFAAYGARTIDGKTTDRKRTLGQ